MPSTTKKLYKLDGVVPIMLTPFNEDGGIDWASLEREIEQGINDGIVGYIVPAVASEVARLTEDERKEMTTRVIRQVNKRIQVFIGASHTDAMKARALAEYGLSQGATGILCAVPIPIIEDKAKAKAHIHEVAKAQMPVLMVQDLHWSGYGMPLDAHLELWHEVESYRCLKLESIPTGPKLTQLTDATKGQLCIGIGWALPQLIENLDRGAQFLTTASVNRPFVRVIQLHRAGKRDEAVELFNATLPFVAFKQQTFDVSMNLLKRYCVRRGLFKTMKFRETFAPFDAHQERIAREVLDSIIAVEDGLEA